MKKMHKIGICSLAVVVNIAMVLAFPLSAYGISPIEAGANAMRGDSQPISLFGVAGVFTSISNTLLFIVGALSVVMLIVGGLRYVISGGNTSAVTSAKNTILYAIIGLIVALLAYAAINFVLAALMPGAGVSNI